MIETLRRQMGDFDLASMMENTGAPSIKTYNGDHHPAYLMLPFLLLVYMFMTTVVLINLLIAQMSSTYEEMSEVAVDEWHYARAGIVLEYMGKTWLPPPLNLLVYAARACAKLCRFLSKHSDMPESEGGRFSLFMGSAQQLEVRRIEREAAKSVVEELSDEQGTEAIPKRVAKRFDELETTLAKIFDKIDKKDTAPLVKKPIVTPRSARMT